MTCGTYLRGISVSGNTVTVTVAAPAGYGWTVILRNSSGVGEAEAVSSGYGGYRLTATTFDTPATTHILEFNGGGLGTESCPVQIIQAGAGFNCVNNTCVPVSIGAQYPDLVSCETACISKGCGYWLTNISVNDKTVSFSVNFSGGSTGSIVLKNSSGAVEASANIGAGTHSLAATTYGVHSLELTCGWSTTNPCEVCGVNIPQPVGGISFASTPSGAEIFIDGADQGVKTPKIATNVPAGSHTYALKLAGYNDYSGTASVVSGQTAIVSATMTPVCVPAWKCETPLNGYENDGCGNRRTNSACNPPQVGNVSFVSTPPGAEIFLDGHDQGAVTPNTVSGVPVGSHAYTLRLAGYNDYTGSVNVVLNQTATVSVALTPACVPAWKCEVPLNGYENDGCGNRRLNSACNPPLPIPPPPTEATGSASFISTPPGAEIFIDGADQGAVTPYIISNIPAGVHTFTLRRTGYNDITGTVTITQGQTASVPAALTPSAAVQKVTTGAKVVIGLMAAGAFGLLGYMALKKEPPARTEYLKYPPGAR